MLFPALLIATMDITAPTARPIATYINVPPPKVMFDTTASMTLFMNRNGGTFTCPGGTAGDDANHNLSSIACGATNGSATVSPFAGSDADWQTVFTCIKNLYAAFNVNVVDVKPTTGQYVECVIGGTPDQVGQGPGVGGVAPFSCAVEPYAIVYDFAEVWGGDLEAVCETAGQETAHAFGLDHEFLCQDPMTYLNGCGDKTFQDEYVPCGEFQPRECNCGTPTQNSVQSFYQLFGSSDGSYTPPVDTQPPAVTIQSPSDGQNLPAAENVVVTAIATDDTGFQDIELDWGFGADTAEHMTCPAGSDTTGDYVCTRDGNTVTWTIEPGVGSRTFHVHAVDIGGHAVDTPDVTVWLSQDGKGPPHDTDPPLITLDAPLADAVLPTATPIQVVATMVDNTGVALAELNWQRQGTDHWIACPTPPPAPGTQTGFGVTCTQSGSTYTWTVQTHRASTRTFQLRATDLLGNVTTTAPQTFTFQAGATLPTVDANDSIETAKTLACGETVKTTGVSTDWYHVDAVKGSQVTVTVDNGIVIATDGKSTLGQATKSSAAKVSAGDTLDLAIVPSSATAGASTLTVTCVPPKATPAKPAAVAKAVCGATGQAPVAAFGLVVAALGVARRRRAR